MAKLVVGLGNPGEKYERTRHNVGWMVLDALAKRLGVEFSREKFNGLYGEAFVNGEKVFLLKPLTYMNRSGDCVGKFARFFKVEPGSVVAVYDDLDLPLGTLRFKPKGSSGGHRGVESLIAALGTKEFPRLRVGIGRPATKEEVVNFVLSPFSEEEWPVIEEAVEKGAQCLELYLKGEPLNRLSSKCNR